MHRSPHAAGLRPQAGLILITPLSPGDIAFRFLEYVCFQQERQRAARSAQAPSWQHPDPDNSAGKEDGPARSRAVVCDINKEMLSVGKQKADSMGIHAGKLGAVPGSVVPTGSFPFGDQRRVCVWVDQVCRGWWETQRSFPLMTTSLIFTPSPLGFETSPMWSRLVTQPPTVDLCGKADVPITTTGFYDCSRHKNCIQSNVTFSVTQ